MFLDVRSFVESIIELHTEAKSVKAPRSGIFLHIPKTGGTSIRSILSSYGNILHKFKKERRIIIMKERLVETDYQYPEDLMEHGFASVVRDSLRNHVWMDAFKFAFVRNPWDRLVSVWAYFELEGKIKFADFAELITEQIESASTSPFHRSIVWHAYPQYRSIYDEHDVCLIDYVGRYERLQEDFNHVCQELGIPKQGLPMKNVSKRKHYTEYYDNYLKDHMLKVYEKDVERFGYEF